MPYKKLWPSQDVYLEGIGSSNYGSNVELKAGRSGGVDYVSLLQFDLSSIPSNATITSAVVYMASSLTATGATHTFHRLVRAWIESEATRLNATASDTWGTALAANTTSDYNSTSLGTMTHPANGVFDSLDVTATVQNWVNGTNSNYGFRISNGTSVLSDWHSREAAIKALWPYLEVFYTLPAITYALNSTTIAGGVQSEWREIPVGLKANAARRVSDWKTHVWTIPETDVSSYQTLIAARGSSFTSLDTNDYEDRNVAANYTTGRVMRVSGRPVGHKVTNVTVEFLVSI